MKSFNNNKNPFKALSDIGDCGKIHWELIGL